MIDQQANSSDEIPTAAEYFLSESLYTKRDIIDVRQALRAEQILTFSETLDAYCVGCASQSVFYRQTLMQTNVVNPNRRLRTSHGTVNAGATSKSPDWAFGDAGTYTGTAGEETDAPLLKVDIVRGIHVIGFQCARNLKEIKHALNFIVLVGEHPVIASDSDGFWPQRLWIQKIGQFPSLADIHRDELKRYRNTLGHEYFSELRTAAGLHAHGVGVGSFVYLRRIFEKLLNDAEKIAPPNGAGVTRFDESIKERIKRLHGYLPESLVTNSAVYSVLSKGIHELSEDECRKYFDVAFLVICEILDERIAAKEKQDKKEALAKALNALNSSLI